MSGPQSNQAPDNGQPAWTDHDAILEQIDAYVLGALDRVDSGIVEQHLRWCQPCREQEEATRRAVDLLPFAVPAVTPPPPAVKTRLLARIENDNRADPYAWSGLAPESDRDVEALASTRQPTIVGGNRSGGPVAAQSSWLRFAPAAIIAPLAIALMVVGAWANSLRQQLDDQTPVQTASGQLELSQIVSNGNDVQLFSMEPQCAGCTGRGRLGVDMSDRVGLVVAWGLNPDREHEVWCVNSRGDRKMVSTLQVDAEGGAMLAFAFPDDDMKDYTGVYIAQTDGEATYMSNLTPADRMAPPATPGTGQNRGIDLRPASSRLTTIPANGRSQA